MHARPADLPQLREYASWGAWLDARAALEDARRRRGGPGGTRVVPLVANSSLPLFVIAGVQKGGTSSLHDILKVEKYGICHSATGELNEKWRSKLDGEAGARRDVRQGPAPVAPQAAQHSP